MKIKVFADTICGWCYIGHSRLNKALEEFKDVQFEIEHMPFQLNPDMPKDGIERSRYLEIKFGSKENAQPMYDRMAEEANKEGLNFNLDTIKKTPNTVLSHLLINLAEKENIAESTVKKEEEKIETEKKAIAEVAEQIIEKKEEKREEREEEKKKNSKEKSDNLTEKSNK